MNPVFRATFVPFAFAILMMPFSVARTNAQLSYAEIVQGDLASPSMPTDIGVLLLGVNTVTGQLENVSTGFDPDAFSFQIPDGLEVSDLSMSILTGDARFLAISEGAISEFVGSENLFTTLISESDVGTNILDGTLNDFAGSGVPGNLGPGSYSVWFQETDGSDVDYSFAITTVSTASVPEPGSVALLCVSMLAAGLRRRRF